MSIRRPNISRFGELVGNSPEMAKVFELVQRAADVAVPVLITGETGTGKELIAREIHGRSQRRDGPFIAVNTGVLSEELVASELFGHVKGAFTGAVAAYDGRFLEANRGSLFLDEIATMSDRIQVVFLRVLEDGVLRPLGAQQDQKMDVRLIAATNVDLRAAVEAGRFREDLLQRLTVFWIQAPPLRDHLPDLPMLAYHFLDLAVRENAVEVTGISDDALRFLADYPWPGNIRELKNVVAQAAIIVRHGVIGPEHIPARITAYQSLPAESNDVAVDRNVTAATGVVADDPVSRTSEPLADPNRGAANVVVPLGLRLEEVQKAYVLKTLAACSNNKTHAAKMLGISRKTLRDWLDRWEGARTGS